jgi:alpha,alpha-trehalase
MRDVLRELAARCRVAIVSGRDRGVVERFIQLDGLIYAGSHGFDIAGPGGMHMQHEEAQAALPDLDDAERKLNRRLKSMAGIQVERKRFALAVHYRRAAEGLALEVERIVDDVLSDHRRLRKRGGKKIFELQPDVDWDKGRAVVWLLETLEPNRTDVLPIYVGDDLTDEDAFRALSGRGVGLLVSQTEVPSEADYRLESTSDVERFLSRIIDLLKDSKE